MTEYLITPCPKPRMTRADKWKKRPIVMRYRAFKDRVRELNVELPEANSHIIFNISMPKSWNPTKRLKMLLRPHQSRPDLDNYLKGLFDAVYKEDSHIWDVRATKLWAEAGSIEIKRAVPNETAPD